MYAWLQGKGGNVRKTARATSQKTFISPISLHEKSQLHENEGNVRKRARAREPNCTEMGEMYGKRARVRDRADRSLTRALDYEACGKLRFNGEEHGLQRRSD